VEKTGIYKSRKNRHFGATLIVGDLINQEWPCAELSQAVGKLPAMLLTN